jgi:hypothetical protein
MGSVGSGRRAGAAGRRTGAQRRRGGRGWIVLASTLIAVGLAGAGAAPARPAGATPAPEAARAWPVPVPAWFWPWARWYLHRGEFANGAFRDAATRPAAAPDRIPPWAWRRLAALVGEPPPGPEPEATGRVVRTWPLPLPEWFWAWARWYLGNGEYADVPRAPGVRPAAAPHYVPEWAWRRLAVLRGEEPPPLPKTTLARGDRGPAVAALQRALNGARYTAGPADGIFGTKTRYGVIAFEKAHALEPDGRVDPDEYLSILRELRPAPPLDRAGGYIYVDLDRQLLFDVQRGRVARVLPVSTGGGYAYTGLDGNEHVAVTPAGTYSVFRKVAGRDTSYLGTLYYPSYFTNGYAVHGSESVPVEPVSHGCVRVPLWIAQELFRRTRIGTPVIVA